MKYIRYVLGTLVFDRTVGIRTKNKLNLILIVFSYGLLTFSVIVNSVDTKRRIETSKSITRTTIYAVQSIQ